MNFKIIQQQKKLSQIIQIKKKKTKKEEKLKHFFGVKQGKKQILFKKIINS